MEIKARDYLFVSLSRVLAPLLLQAGDIETSLMRRRLAEIPIERPVFICGLARSGTTLLLNLISKQENVATHRYRDFPLLLTALSWNWLQDRLATEDPFVERPHRDRIRINRESPEAFEEPIWQHFFPWLHDRASSHILDASFSNERFENFYRAHISKILLLRKGSRYVSKGNYNVARIGYLAKLFPDARFIIPVREPLAHVQSLVKQHRLFTHYAARDPRVPNYLKATGHYEFGPQRRPINFFENGEARVLGAWERGADHLGYASMWSDVYSYITDLLQRKPELASRVFICRFEDLCCDPCGEMEQILDFCELGAVSSLGSLDHVTAPLPEIFDSPDEEAVEVRSVIRFAAERFGYDNQSRRALHGRAD